MPNDAYYASFDRAMKNEATASVIEVKNLACGYGENVVLQEVSFSVRAQELFA